MRIKINLKKGFLKGRISQQQDVIGEVEFENGNVFDIYFFLDKKVIEITHKEKMIQKNKLTQKNRMFLIEKLLSTYTQMLGSIRNFTTQYNIESFKLVDTTAIDISMVDFDNLIPNETIIEEYLKSEYAKTSDKNLYRTLSDVYEALKENEKKLEFENIEIPIEHELNAVEKMDLKYFTSVVIRSIFKKVLVTVDIKKETVIIKPS